MEKLIKIQQELKAPKNQYNKFGNYKYRSQEDILEAVKPLLSKYECSIIITDEIKEVAGIPYIESSVTFIDGDNPITVKSSAGIDVNKKGMDYAQSFGASSSYARKYALNGLFLIDDTKDADSTNTHGKEPAKGGKKPILVPYSETFEKAKEAISTGTYTIEDVRKKYEVDKETEKLLYK